jgi:hypothetical protein
LASLQNGGRSRGIFAVKIPPKKIDFCRTCVWSKVITQFTTKPFLFTQIEITTTTMSEYTIKIFRELPLSHLQNPEQYKGKVSIRETIIFDWEDEYEDVIIGVQEIFDDYSFNISKEIMEKDLAEYEEEVEEETMKYFRKIMSKMEDGIVYMCEIDYKD